MPSHQERIRAKNPEMTCEHLWIFVADSNKAPYINEDGTRTTWKRCMNCDIHHKFTRSQADFEAELKRMFIWPE